MAKPKRKPKNMLDYELCTSFAFQVRQALNTRVLKAKLGLHQSCTYDVRAETQQSIVALLVVESTRQARVTSYVQRLFFSVGLTNNHSIRKLAQGALQSVIVPKPLIMSLDASSKLSEDGTKPKAESTKLAKAQELFDLAWQAMSDHADACRTSAEIQEVLSVLHVWCWRLAGVLGKKVSEDRVRALQHTEEKTKEWAPLFKELGFDAICTYYDCKRQDGFKSSVYVTQIVLDFPGLGGIEETTTIDFKCFNGEEFNFELCVWCNDDCFQVEYEDPRCFSIPVSQGQETVPPCVWTALERILPVLVQHEAPRGEIPSYVKAWCNGKTSDDTLCGGVYV